MKIVINRCFGGFGLSQAVYDYLGIPWDGYGHSTGHDRFDPKLIEAIEAVGLDKAGGEYAELAIVEIPDDVEWEIEEYDGIESVHEKHRSWG